LPFKILFFFKLCHYNYRYIEEHLVFAELIDNFYSLAINDVVDKNRKQINVVFFVVAKLNTFTSFFRLNKDALNVIHLKYDGWKNFYFSFETYESKLNFVNSLQYVKTLSI
jgi:hypothetical protein